MGASSTTVIRCTEISYSINDQYYKSFVVVVGAGIYSTVAGLSKQIAV